MCAHGCMHYVHYAQTFSISSAKLVWVYAAPVSLSFLKSIPWFQNSNKFYGKLDVTSSNRLKITSLLSAISLLQGKLKGNDPWNTATLGGYGNPFNCTLLPAVTISRYYLPITLIAISLGCYTFTHINCISENPYIKAWAVVNVSSANLSCSYLPESQRQRQAHRSGTGMRGSGSTATQLPLLLHTLHVSPPTAKPWALFHSWHRDLQVWNHCNHPIRAFSL